jgi:hypothetical protein
VPENALPAKLTISVWKNKVQTSERKMEFNNPTDGPFNILIGVSAPGGVTTGQFTIKVKLKLTYFKTVRTINIMHRPPFNKIQL